MYLIAIFISSEKVTIPQDKPYIILEGDPKHLTVIEFGDAGSVVNSPTFKSLADNFVAKNIVFKVKHLRTLIKLLRQIRTR